MDINIFSIIIPVYNGADFIIRCLKSILPQHMSYDPQYEVIVVDDASTDNTVQLIQDNIKSPNLKLIQLPKNSRQGAARNRGVEIAKGKYILYLDADDFWKDGAISKMIETLKNSETELIMYDHERRNEETGNLISSMYYSKNPQNEMSGECYLKKAEIPWEPWLTAYKKSFLIEHNIRFAENVRFEDTDYVLKCCLLAKSVRYIPLNIVVYAHRTGSTVQIGNNFQKIKENFMTGERICETINRYHTTHVKGCDCLLNHYTFLYDSLVKRTLWRLKYKEIKEILKTYPFQTFNRKWKDRPHLWGGYLTSCIPSIYAFSSQFIRPILLQILKLRKK